MTDHTFLPRYMKLPYLLVLHQQPCEDLAVSCQCCR